MAFWSPSAFGQLAQSESGGNPSLVHYPNNVAWGGSSTSGSSASGLYGYTTGTWQTYAPQAGVDINQYPYAYTAPASVQNQVLAITPISNWTCPNCNSVALRMSQNPDNLVSSPASLGSGGGANINVNAGNGEETTPYTQGVDPVTGEPDWVLPDVNAGTPPTYGSGSGGGTAGTTATSAQIAGGGSPSGSITNTGVLGGVTGASGAGTPVQVNLGAGTVADIGKWISEPITAAQKAVTGYLDSVSNWFVRAGLVMLAIVIIGIALWRLSGGPPVTQVVASAAKAA